jgi:hypothetical protein
MIDILKDIVKHTHGLGFLDLVKITGTESETAIDSMAEDRSVILQGSFHKPQAEMAGTFGMPQLSKLDIHLKCPEYRDKANIKVIKGNRNGAETPVSIHFENEKGDFKNDYRFMNAEIINEKLKTVKFKGVKWDVEIEPLWQVYRDSTSKPLPTLSTALSLCEQKTANSYSHLVIRHHTVENLYLQKVSQARSIKIGVGQ